MSIVPNPIRDALTPETLAVIEAVDRAGSMAGAARELGVVPSAITYRIRQLEDALDVLLFDRSSRQARLTPAGQELLREGQRLLLELDAVANRVKRVATGWEPELTLAVDSVLSRHAVLELCEAFFALQAPTRLRLREEALSGTLQALHTGQADVALGVATEIPMDGAWQSQTMGDMLFVYAVAPHHPLALEPEPLSDAQLRTHRAVAVADSVQRGSGVSIGLMGGQEVFTVPGMPDKLHAQLRGLGGGFLPDYLARPYIATGRLVEKQVQRGPHLVPLCYAWRRPSTGSEGQALGWWLQQLGQDRTRQALLSRTVPHWG